MKPSAQNAIATLSELSKHIPTELLAYWVTPNIILTLAGARAYCDGVFWGDQKEVKHWQQEATQSLDALRQIIYLDAEQPNIISNDHGDMYLSYEVLYLDGLKYSLSQTQLVYETDKQLVLQGNSFKAIHEQLQSALKTSGTLPATEYANEATDHAAFGILVGYPDKAIIGAIPTWDRTDPFAEPTIGADIRGVAYYDCPQPRYEYPRHLINDPDIQAHEKLWSGILRDYYTSEFHKGLEANDAFQAKLTELNLIEL